MLLAESVVGCRMLAAKPTATPTAAADMRSSGLCLAATFLTHWQSQTILLLHSGLKPFKYRL